MPLCLPGLRNRKLKILLEGSLDDFEFSFLTVVWERRSFPYSCLGEKMIYKTLRWNNISPQNGWPVGETKFHCIKKILSKEKNLLHYDSKVIKVSGLWSVQPEFISRMVICCFWFFLFRYSFSIPKPQLLRLFVFCTVFFYHIISIIIKIFIVNLCELPGVIFNLYNIWTFWPELESKLLLLGHNIQNFDRRIPGLVYINLN